MRGRARFWAIALLVPVMLSGCGGGSAKVSANSYADSVCSNVKTWFDAIRQRATAIQTAVSPGTSAQKGQQVLGSYLDGVISDTKTMVSGIQGAGRPDVPNGDKLASTLLSGLQQAESAFEDARNKVDQLPTSSRSAFSHAAEQLSTTIQSEAAGITQAFSGLRSPQLDRAFRSASACRTPTPTPSP
jgi:hypothetical protein